MKEYPISKDEIFGLGGTSVFATTLIAFGSASWQRSQDIERNLELSQGIPETTIARWKAKQEDAHSNAILFFVAGAVVALFWGWKVWSIISNTTHPDAPPSRGLRGALISIWYGDRPPSAQ